MPRRVYMNSIRGQQRIHVEFLAAEIPEVLEDLYESSLGRNRETEQLRLILEEAQERFAPPAPPPPAGSGVCDRCQTWEGNPDRCLLCPSCGQPWNRRTEETDHA